MSEITDQENIDSTASNSVATTTTIASTPANNNDNDDTVSTTLNEENLKIDNEDEDEIDEENVNYSNNSNTATRTATNNDDLNAREHVDKIEPTPLQPPFPTDESTSKDIPDLEEDATEEQPKQEDVKKEDEVSEEPSNEANNEASNEEEEEEEEGETRCICGELDPPDESGLFIQCEQCGVWQHGYCVGITNDDTPDKYWCEQCKPELHRLYVTDLGENRSIYKPVQGIRRNKKRLTRQSSSLSSSKKSKNKSENSLNPPSPTASTSSNDNKNISDVSSSQISNNDTTLTGSRSTRSHDTTATATTNTSKTEDNGHTNENTLINKSQPDSVNSINHADNDEPSSTPYDEDDRRLQDRKRATFLAREEKQYQRMLEKAIKESKRASGDSAEDLMMDDEEEDEEEDEDTASTTNNTNISNQDRTTDDIKQPTPVTAAKKANPDELGSTISIQDSIRSETPDQLSETSSTSLKRAPTPVRKSQRATKRPRRTATPTERVLKGGRRGKNSRTGGVGNGNNSGTATETGSTQGTVSRTNSEVNLDKPVKPRLPPARTTLNEMRRRTSAILEFISRTQWELSEEQQTKEELIKFVENDDFINKVNGVYDKYNESLSLMDDLTRNLLLWEQKYSFNKNTNTNNTNNASNEES